MVEVLNARAVAVRIGRSFSGRAMVQRTTDNEQASSGASHEIAFYPAGATKAPTVGETVEDAAGGARFEILRIGPAKHAKGALVALCRVVAP